jgi:hypothetical protein
MTYFAMAEVEADDIHLIESQCIAAMIMCWVVYIG